MTEETRMYMFEFRGRAEILRRAEGQKESPNESEIVRQLNNNSTLIAQAIQQELVRGLSPSLTVQAQIHFYEGSISFAGVIVLLDAIATLAGATEFLATFSRLVEIVVQGVMQKWILNELDSANFTTSIHVEVSQPMHRRQGTLMSFRTLERLMLANLVLLLILSLLLLPSLLPNPTPIPTTITPTRTLTLTLSPTNTLTLTPSFTPSLTPSSTNTLTPTITPTPTITLTPSPTGFPP
jgi:hypothetical protein